MKTTGDTIEIVTHLIADKFILGPIQSKAGDVECIYITNEVGSRIWELLVGVKSMGEIRDTIVGEFNFSSELAEADLVDFLKQLETAANRHNGSGNHI